MRSRWLPLIDRNALVNRGGARQQSRNSRRIIFDSGIDTEAFVPHISTDNYHAGEIAAQRMGEILGGKGKVAMVAVQAGAASTMAREQGFEDYVAKNLPGIQIVDKRYGDAEVAKSPAGRREHADGAPGDRCSVRFKRIEHHRSGAGVERPLQQGPTGGLRRWTDA